MSGVRVITDSISCLPPDLVAACGIGVVPINLILGDRSYRDEIDMTRREFYELLPKAKKLPTTSAPSPADFLEAYRNLGEGAEGILCITAVSKLSATFESARLAREMAHRELPQLTVEILDSRSALGSQGLVVLAAARAAEEGRDLAQVIQAAQEAIPRVNLVAMLDTLYYLMKGGRVPMVAAWASSLLSIKPIIELAGGEVVPLERPRTKPRALKRLAGIAEERAAGRATRVMIHHANTPEEAAVLEAEVRSRINCSELYITEASPVIGTHVGPGLLAITFLSEER